MKVEMDAYEFTGVEATNVGLPDGMVIECAPGDIVNLPYDDPSPLLRKSKKRPTRETPDNLLGAPAPEDPKLALDFTPTPEEL